MDYTENRNRNGELVGYWDQNGKACLLEDPFVLDGDGNATTELKEGHTITPMTAEEIAAIAAAAAAADAEFASTQYQRDRQGVYPSIGDQLDALWKGGQAAADMLAQVQAVKAQFPKPAQE